MPVSTVTATGSPERHELLFAITVHYGDFDRSVSFSSSGQLRFVADRRDRRVDQLLDPLAGLDAQVVVGVEVA